MRILTWNINGVSFWDSKPRYSRIKEAIKSYHPDLVLLQEVIFPWDNSFIDSIEGYYISNRKIVRSTGLAALTKDRPVGINYDFFKEQARLFNPKQLSDKILRKGYQEIDLGELVVINTHLADSYHPEDIADSTVESQAEQLLDHVRERKREGRKIIMGGDFNFRKDSPLYDAFVYEVADLTAGLPVKSSEGTTIPCYGRGYHKLDFIFANFGQIASSGYVAHPSFGEKYPSDHPGIFVDIHRNCSISEYGYTGIHPHR